MLHFIWTFALRYHRNGESEREYACSLVVAASCTHLGAKSGSNLLRVHASAAGLVQRGLHSVLIALLSFMHLKLQLIRVWRYSNRKTKWHIPGSILSNTSRSICGAEATACKVLCGPSA